MAHTQEHIIACQLCPDVETMLQVEMVDPSTSEYKAGIERMFAHFKEQHGLTDDQCRHLKVRPTMFADGARGWAQQKKHWILPATETEPERLVAGYQWTREAIGKPAKRGSE